MKRIYVASGQRRLERGAELLDDYSHAINFGPILGPWQDIFRSCHSCTQYSEEVAYWAFWTNYQYVVWSEHYFLESMMKSAIRLKRQQGLTIVTRLLVVAIIGILASLALPSFQDATDKYRLKGAVDALRGDLQFARLQAINSKQTVFINFSTGASWCYGMKLGSACTCATAGSCDLKQIDSTNVTGATLTTITFASDPSFDPVRGLASPAGNAVFQSPLGKQAQVKLSLVGKVDICTPAGASSAGYPAC